LGHPIKRIFHNWDNKSPGCNKGGYSEAKTVGLSQHTLPGEPPILPPTVRVSIKGSCAADNPLEDYIDSTS